MPSTTPRARRSKPTQDASANRASRRASRAARRDAESDEDSARTVDSDREAGAEQAARSGRRSARTAASRRAEVSATESEQGAESDLQSGAEPAGRAPRQHAPSAPADGDSEHAPHRAHTRRGGRASRLKVALPSDSDSDERDPPPTRRQRGRKAAGARSAPKRRGGARTSARAPAEELSMPEYVARLRARLFSEDAAAPLPARLDAALRAVEAAVHPALRGARSGSAAVLLVGARGSGKSAVVSRLLCALGDAERAPTVVSLHGLLHAAPGAAFRAIARALGGSGHGGAQHCLGEIAARVAALRESGAALLFVLDEFHRFVHAANAGGQTTLYAIFNLLQDAALRAAAVCVTPHIDVPDHLEKRVKSRFTHRVVYVPMPTAPDETLSFLRAALLGHAGAPPRAEAVVHKFLHADTVRGAVQRQFQRDRAAGAVLAAVDISLLSSLALVGGTGYTDTVVHDAETAFLTALERWGSARDFIGGLATLELALLLALTRLETRDARRVYLFDDVFREYQGLATGGQDGMLRAQLAHIEPRPLAAKAWERVVEAGLVARAPGLAGVRRVELAVAPNVVRDALKEHPAATTLMQRWGAGGVVQ